MDVRKLLLNGNDGTTLPLEQKISNPSIENLKKRVEVIPPLNNFDVDEELFNGYLNKPKSLSFIGQKNSANQPIQTKIIDHIDPIRDDYASAVNHLLRQYQESFNLCKTKMNLVGLLNEFDFNRLKGDKYRLICRYLIPFIMALNDPDFDHQAKIDGLVLFRQKYAAILAKKSGFIFKPSGIEFNDAYNFLKLIVMYNFCLMSGSDEYLNQLKKCNPNINFDQLNTIEAIVNFDCIKDKKIELLEQKDPDYQVPLRGLLVSEDLEKIIFVAQMQEMLNRSSFLFCYFNYKKLMQSFELEPAKRELLHDFFWNVYLKEAFLNNLRWLLAMITKPFDYIASCFD
jgi:hypothetical protein